MTSRRRAPAEASGCSAPPEDLVSGGAGPWGGDVRAPARPVSSTSPATTALKTGLWSCFLRIGCHGPAGLLVWFVSPGMSTGDRAWVCCRYCWWCLGALLSALLSQDLEVWTPNTGRGAFVE